MSSINADAYAKMIGNWIEIDLTMLPEGTEMIMLNLENFVPESESDPVNHPSHYTQGGIECIEAIKASMTHAEFLGYLKGNVMKYLWRYENKNNPQEDIEKAIWYLTRLKEELDD